MLEKELGAALFQALGKYRWKAFKLNNDEMQRGLLDYILWGDGIPVFQFELKRAGDHDGAIAAMNSNQWSIFKSQARSKYGSLIVWGEWEAKYGGIIWAKPTDGKVQTHQYDVTIERPGKDALATAIAEKLYEISSYWKL